MIEHLLGHRQRGDLVRDGIIEALSWEEAERTRKPAEE